MNKTYRVYVQQVNQTYVEVKARDAQSAAEKGYAKWRSQEARSEVIAVIAAEPMPVEPKGLKS